MLNKIYEKFTKNEINTMVDINGYKYRKEIVEAAEIICGLLSNQELEWLEQRSGSRRFSFRDQILITYYNYYPMYSMDRMKEVAKVAIENFKPFFKLKDDDCGINKILLDRFKDFLFEEEKGWTARFEKRFEEIFGEQQIKQSK